MTKHDLTEQTHPSLQSAYAIARETEDLGAFIYLAEQKPESASDQNSDRSKGSLADVPIVVKDNIHVADMPNSAGTISLKDFVPEHSNAVVNALEQSGAVVIGKTNMHELAFGITSNNAAFGAVKNAHDPTVFAGGSSGGTAAAIAAGVARMGLGTDTGGSTRIPAALNGIVGFRPTMGRYDSTRVTPISSTRDTVGPMALSVADIALMDSVICNTDIATPTDLTKLRLGIAREYFYAGLADDVHENIEHVLSQLRSAGVELVEVPLPKLEMLNNQTGLPIAMWEFATQMPAYLRDYNAGVSFDDLVAGIKSPDVKMVVQSQFGDGAVSQEMYNSAMSVHRPKLQALYQNAFEKYQVDAFICATTPCVAQPITNSDETIELNGQQVPTFPTFIKHTDPSSNAGLPSLSLPSGLNRAGLPMGVLLDGPVQSDQRLIEISLAIEELLQSNRNA